MRKSRTSLICSAIGAVILSILLTASGDAQIGTATLSGVVTDPSGAAIPNAKLTLSNTLLKYIREQSTDVRGMYVITAIPPGHYSLVVKAAGFRITEKTDVYLTPGQASTLNVALSLGKTTQQVIVSAAPPLLPTGNATLGEVVSTTAVQNLPLSYENFSQVILTLPATSPINGSSYRNDSFEGTGVDPEVYGQRQRNNFYTIDGVNNTDADDSANVFPPPEAIEEMKVQSGMTSAVYGVGSGANISLVTKSGTNQIHGDGWEMNSNNGLNARGFFVPQEGVYTWNQFGGDVGGPVIIPHLISRNKGWYFYGYYQGVREKAAAHATALVPTAAQLNGDFSGFSPIYNPYTTTTNASGVSARQPFPGNIIPTGTTNACAPQPTCINSSTLTVAKAYYPAPNLPAGIIPGENFLNSNSDDNLDDAWNIRIDHQFNAKDSMMVRYTRNAWGLLSWSDLPFPTRSSSWLHNLAVDETHVFDPTFVVSSRFGIDDYARSGSSTILPGDLAAEAGTTAGWPTFTAFTGGSYTLVPSMSIAGYSGDGESLTLPSPEDNYQWNVDATKTKGEHTIQWGFFAQYFHHESINAPNNGVDFEASQTSNFTTGTGDGFASYLLGLPYEATTTIGDSSGINNGHAFSGYLQDDIRATRRLTLNLGLRYDYYAPLVNIIGSGGFEWETGQYWWNKTNPITGAPANISPGVLTPDHKDFQPRFGIAYELTPKTVVRAGYGIFDDNFGFEYSQGQQGNRGNWPFASPVSVSGLNATTVSAVMPDPFPTPPTATTTAESFNQNLETYGPWTRTPYIYEWTLSVARTLSPTMTLQAAYFGSAGFRLDGQYLDDTALTPGPGPISARQRYPQFAPGYVTNVNNVFHSNYEGGTLTLDKRTSHGLMLNANATWQRCMDYTDDAANQVGPSRIIRLYPISWYYGQCGWNLPWQVNGDYVYQLPFNTHNKWLNGAVAGWALSGILTFSSGQPYTPVLSEDPANIGTGNEFVRLVGNWKLSNPTPEEWFNTAAFAVPAPYTFGNFGRNTMWSQGMANWNVSLMKRWHFTEDKYLELRASAFNVTNDVIFGVPGTTIGTSSFGTVSSQWNPARELQLQAQMHF